MSLRVLFCRIRPGFCWIGLFPLNFWHLTDRMLFARRGKQGCRKENSKDALANEGSHSAVAQLSVSALQGESVSRSAGARGDRKEE